MGFKRIMVDTNICIDAVITRKPFAANALRIIDLSESGKIDAYVSAHTFDTIFYALRKKISVPQRYALLRELRLAFSVADVSEATIDSALQLEWPDLEDAIHYQAALQADCDAIITRNPQDFRDGRIEVLSPAQLLAVM